MKSIQKEMPVPNLPEITSVEFWAPSFNGDRIDKSKESCFQSEKEMFFLRYCHSMEQLTMTKEF